MAFKKLYLNLFAVGACFSSVAQTTLEPIEISIDENTKTNSTIGKVGFLDGEVSSTVQIEVGKTSIKNWSTNGEAFEPVPFTTSFLSAPIIFGQIQSASDYKVEYAIDTYSYTGAISRSGQDFIMRHRLQNVNASGFEAILESQLDKRGTSVVTDIISTGAGETLGWFAVSGPAQGVWRDKQFEVLSTGVQVTHKEYRQTFTAPFMQTPTLISSIASFNGIEQSGIAINDLNENRVNVFIDDLDDGSHNAESVSLMMIEGSDFLATQSNAIFGETGV